MNILGVRTIAVLSGALNGGGCSSSSPELSLPDPTGPAAFPSRTRVSSSASPSVNRMVTGIVNDSVEVEVQESGM